MKGEFSPRMKPEMVNFVETELSTKDWMRAQSLRDPAATASDRADHGPMGAYAAWPAETMAAMCELGRFDKAPDFLHHVAAVTSEGPFSQSSGNNEALRLAGRNGDHLQFQWDTTEYSPRAHPATIVQGCSDSLDHGPIFSRR